MSKNVRVYRFFNLDKNEHGQPFAECDDHINEYKRKRKPAAPQLILEKIADDAVWPCNKCEWDEAERNEQRLVKQALARAGAQKAGLTTEKLVGMLDVDTPDPVWNVVLRNREKSGIGVSVQSDAWSYREDLSDIDQVTYEIIAKTRPVREEC